MQEITRKYKVYQFSELSEDVKDKVIQNLYDINVDSEFWYECTIDELREDLKENYGIEFKDVYFDIDRGSYAWLLHASVEDEKKFLKKAGFDLRSKGAREILESGISIETVYYGGGNASNDCISYYSSIPELNDCLKDRLEDFLSNLRQSYDYLTSEKAIIETIEVNEYTFLENGKMFNV